MKSNRILAKTTGLFWILNSVCAAGAAEPFFTRVPDGGIQPQALTASDSTVHLIYYKGDAKAGNVFYARRPPGAFEFGAPVQVNSSPGSAIAIGTIRGAQFAVGRGNRIHVAWNGSGTKSAPGMMYSRLNNKGTGFEPERNLMVSSEGLDGGGSVAADGGGNVYVVWQALLKGAPKGETNREVFVAVSNDDGATFAPERRADQNHPGACACCGMKAYANDSGKLFILYRSAHAETQRDETLLVSNDHANDFVEVFSHPWSVNTCPMSSAWLGSGAANHVIAGWETKGRTWFMNLDTRAGAAPQPFSTASSVNQKHPTAVANAADETLLVWTEGTGWQKGGALAWRVVDANGNLVGQDGRKAGVPVWSFGAAIVRPDQTFEIFY